MNKSSCAAFFFGFAFCSMLIAGFLFLVNTKNLFHDHSYNTNINNCHEEYVKFLDPVALVKAGRYQGSGVAFQRRGHTFFWTAAHVTAGVRIDRADKNLYNDVELVRERYHLGRNVGQDTAFAKVLFYSGIEDGDDLCLCYVYDNNFFKHGAKFVGKDYVPVVGDKTIHSGSPNGQTLPSMLVFGHITHTGRLRNICDEDHCSPFSRIFDVMYMPVEHGCSGGGVFNEQGQILGLLTQGLSGTNINVSYMVPTRRMWEFAERVGCLWALDENVELPEGFLRNQVTDVFP